MFAFSALNPRNVCSALPGAVLFSQSLPQMSLLGGSAKGSEPSSGLGWRRRREDDSCSAIRHQA